MHIDYIRECVGTLTDVLPTVRQSSVPVAETLHGGSSLLMLEFLPVHVAYSVSMFLSSPPSRLPLPSSSLRRLVHHLRFFPAAVPFVILPLLLALWVTHCTRSCSQVEAEVVCCGRAFVSCSFPQPPTPDTRLLRHSLPAAMYLSAVMLLWSVRREGREVTRGWLGKKIMRI